MLMVSLPTTVYANEYIVSKVESLIAWGYWAVLLGALSGGIAATFIKTEVDDRLSYDILAKLLIGTGLGFFASISYMAHFPDTDVLKLALPSFVLGCLGAPIVVFLLTWASDPDTFKKANKKLNKTLKLSDEDNEGDI